MAAGTASNLPDLIAFADGLRRERSELLAALSLPWSTGLAEGRITRLKPSRARVTATSASTRSSAASSGPRDHAVSGRAEQVNSRFILTPCDSVDRVLTVVESTAHVIGVT